MRFEIKKIKNGYLVYYEKGVSKFVKSFESKDELLRFIGDHIE